jgi:hypothetical protein
MTANIAIISLCTLIPLILTIFACLLFKGCKDD